MQLGRNFGDDEREPQELEKRIRRKVSRIVADAESARPGGPNGTEAADPVPTAPPALEASADLGAREPENTERAMAPAEDPAARPETAPPCPTSHSVPDPAARTDVATELGEPDDYAAFLEFRFGHHLRNYQTYGGLYAFAFTALSVIGIASGAASAAIAAGWGDSDHAKELLVALGLLAAISAAVIQIWRPAEKASSRYRGANALRREGWNFLLNRGRFNRVPPKVAVESLVDEVSSILQQAAVVDEGAAEGAPPGQPAGH